MTNYSHTQRGKVILGSMAASAILVLIIGLQISKPALLLLPVLLLAAWLFHSLTIEVAGGVLKWRFGPGWISREVQLSEISSARVVRTNFLEGWGIHLSRFGWLHNVSGFDAVVVTLRNGKKFALGTDEPEKLEQALQPGMIPAAPSAK